MEIKITETSITGKPKEIKKLLDATGGSNEQLVTYKDLQKEIKKATKGMVKWKA